MGDSIQNSKFNIQRFNIQALIHTEFIGLGEVSEVKVGLTSSIDRERARIRPLDLAETISERDFKEERTCR